MSVNVAEDLTREQDALIPSPGDRGRLAIFSFLMLFVELALIRWTGSNVLYLSYFSNFVLLGSFLGIGVGFLRARSRLDLSPYVPVALTCLVAIVLLVPVKIDRANGDLVFFGGEPTGLPIWVTLPLIFALVAGTLMMIGEGVARLFIKFEPLEAYRLDIAGSICGIAAFSALSFLRAPSVVWGAVVAFVLIALLGYRSRLYQVGFALGLVALLLAETLAPNISWSPYYKVETFDRINGYVTQINVNGIAHQGIASVEVRRQIEPLYFVPYGWRTAPTPGDVLVIGAGTGSDVAIALAAGATHVDAVEIDPRLYEIGVEKHPDHPYDDPRVDVTINDGRAFLEHTDHRYDTIFFALPDSLTLVAGSSSLRLESYLFTKQALASAREHLNESGTFAMYNFYRERWLIDRLAGTLDDIYGVPPCIDAAPNNLAVMMVSNDAAALECDTTWERPAEVVEPATDDHPFLYLRERSIPSFYLVTMALILLASLVVVRGAGGPMKPMASYLDLFFMGMAFLLLETKSVVQFALLFGTTWFVNALVFAGVLVSVYIAVELAGRVKLPRRELLYALLVVSLVVAWLIEPARLLHLDFPVRFAASVALTFTPIFIANLIFAERFRNVESSTTAFGANLLGAMVGGLLEYCALIIGYHALIPIVGVLYLAAFLLSRRADAPAAARVSAGLTSPA